MLNFDNFVVSSPSPKRCPLGVNKGPIPNCRRRRKHLRIPQISKQICTEEQQFCLPESHGTANHSQTMRDSRILGISSAFREINIVCVSKTWRNIPVFPLKMCSKNESCDHAYTPKLWREVDCTNQFFRVN